MRTRTNTATTSVDSVSYVVVYTDPLGWAHHIDAQPEPGHRWVEPLTEQHAHEVAEQVRNLGNTNVAVYPAGLLTLLRWVQANPVAITDDHPDFDHLDPAPCTHRTNTPDHLRVCCADGVDCDRCNQPIPLTELDPRTLGPTDAAICTDCAEDGEM